MKKTIIAALILSPLFSYSHGSKIGIVSDSIDKVLKVINNEGGVIKDSFTGIKSWVNKSDILVKVYYKQKEKGVSVVYTCNVEHKDGKEALLCNLNKK